ncbi:hypothetical protein Tco_0690455 [Tanacetum coccineum]
MAAPVISISSDVSAESVGSSFPQVILTGSIPIEVPVASEVGAAVVASPVRVLELDTYSSSEVDPSKSLPPPVSVAPMVLLFICSDDSELDTKIPERHVLPTSHDVMLTRWRSRVTSRSSSPTTSIPEIPTAPILPAPSAIVAPSSEFPLAPDIPIGRLYRTHPGGPCKALTVKKSVRPLSSHRLTLRHSSHHLDHFTSRSSSSHSSSDHSSSRHSISGHSLSGHTPLDTTDADTSTPPRFVHSSLARTLRCSEAYLRWRSPAAIVTSSIHTTRALVLSRADFLPPRKRFRDSILPEDSIEEDIDTDVLEDIEADATAVKVIVDRDVEVGIDAGIDMEVDVGVDVEDEVEDEVESNDRGTIEVGVDVVAGIDIPNAMLMPDAVEHLEQVEEGLQDIYDHRASLLEQVASLERSNARLRGTMMMDRARADRFRRHVRFMESELRQIRRFCYYDMMRFRRLETFANMTITRSGMTPKAIEELVDRRVEEALAAYEATRAANALEAESQSQNGSDDDNGNGGNGNGGDGNGGNGNGGNGNPNENNRDDRPVVRECTYQDFMKCQPLNFKGTEGVFGLIRWFEKMEIVFHWNRGCIFHVMKRTHEVNG